MSSRDSVLGVCPHCRGDVPPGGVLIEYERSSGDRAIYAECPDCGRVVRPVE